MSTSQSTETGEKGAWKSWAGKHPEAWKIAPDSVWDEDDDVKATVDVGRNKKGAKLFKVANTKWDGAQWSYQLKTPEGQLQNDGQWFLEGELSGP